MDTNQQSVQEAINRLRSDLGNLDPAIHGDDLQAATELALEDLTYLEEQLQTVQRERHEAVEDALRLGAFSGKDEAVAEVERLKEQLEAVGVEYVCAHDHKWHTLGIPTRCPMCNTSSFAASSPARCPRCGGDLAECRRRGACSLAPSPASEPKEGA